MSIPLILANSIGTTSKGGRFPNELSGALWRGVVPQLSRGRGRDRDVIGWDLPGHGETPADSLRDLSPGATTIEDLAALVLAFADRRGVTKFDFAGVSLGGAIGVWLAANRPDRVNALAVVCSSAHFGGEDAWRARAERVRVGGLEAMSELADTAPDRWFPAGAPIRATTAAADLVAGHRIVDPAGYAACCDAIAALDLTSELRKVSAPTLILAGRDDPATPPRHARELADGIADSALIELPGIGHLAPVEAPDRVASALEEHFGGVGGRSAAGMAVRRAVLGDEHVDRAIGRTTPFTAPFQDLITRYAWGEIWTRPGLDRRTRSCITLTALVARGHLEELAMHVRAALNNGLTSDEISEVLLQTAVYCGVPAANAAFAVAQRVLDEVDSVAGADGVDRVDGVDPEGR